MECPTCGKTLSTEQGMRQHHTKVHGDPLPNRTCIDCGTEFYDPKSRRTHCGDCYSETGTKNGNYTDATETTDCRRCGSSFEYYPSTKDGVFCSKCVADANGLLPSESSPLSKIQVSCEHCGSKLERHPSRIESSSYGAFCDLDCYGAWLSEHVVGESHHQWEGGSIPYGSSWWEVRHEAWERDDFECQLCGTGAETLGRNPDVHHIRPVRDFEDPSNAHELENLVCLCRSCHRRVEDGNLTVPSA